MSAKVSDLLLAFSYYYLKAKQGEVSRDKFIDLVEDAFSLNIGGAVGVRGFTNYQRDLLKEILFGEEDTYVIVWSRQVGKTTIMGVLASVFVLVNYPRKVEVLVIGPILRYSQNLFRSVNNALSSVARNWRLVADTRTGFVYDFINAKSQTQIYFSWGSRIVCLPAKQIRGFSPNVVMIDECAFMPEDSWQEILPMLKAKKEIPTKLILTSTPFGTAGRFYEFWMSQKNQGYPFHITYKDCPFMDKESIERELREGLMTESEFKREYLAEFVEAEGRAIPDSLIQKSLADYEIWGEDYFD